VQRGPAFTAVAIILNEVAHGTGGQPQSAIVQQILAVDP
jgi:hypothetical protein